MKDEVLKLLESKADQDETAQTGVESAPTSTTTTTETTEMSSSESSYESACESSTVKDEVIVD
jgi:hypothetical protein